MPTEFGFENKDDLEKSRLQKLHENELQALTTASRINLQIQRVLIDFFSSLSEELYLSSKGTIWRGTTNKPEEMPSEANWGLKGMDYWDQWESSMIKLVIKISFDVFVTKKGVANLGGLPHLYVLYDLDEDSGLSIDNLFKLCEVLHRETSEVVVLASVADFLYEQIWPTEPPALQIIGPRVIHDWSPPRR